MKGTLQEITGQESGFQVLDGLSILDNWSSDGTDYAADLRKARKVNVLDALIDIGAIKVLKEDYWDDNDADVVYGGRRLVINYRADANPVTVEELNVDGILYRVDDFVVVAPDGWV